MALLLLLRSHFSYPFRNIISIFFIILAFFVETNAVEGPALLQAQQLAVVPVVKRVSKHCLFISF